MLLTVTYSWKSGYRERTFVLILLVMREIFVIGDRYHFCANNLGEVSLKQVYQHCLFCNIRKCENVT